MSSGLPLRPRSALHRSIEATPYVMTRQQIMAEDLAASYLGAVAFVDKLADGARVAVGYQRHKLWQRDVELVGRTCWI